MTSEKEVINELAGEFSNKIELYNFNNPEIGKFVDIFGIDVTNSLASLSLFNGLHNLTFDYKTIEKWFEFFNVKDITNKKNQNFLHKAIKAEICTGDDERLNYKENIQKEDVIKALIHIFKGTGALDFQDINGNTPLHLAILEDRLEIIKELLRAGADYSIPNKANETAKDLLISNDYAIDMYINDNITDTKFNTLASFYENYQGKTGLISIQTDSESENSDLSIFKAPKKVLEGNDPNEMLEITHKIDKFSINTNSDIGIKNDAEILGDVNE